MYALNKCHAFQVDCCVPVLAIGGTVVTIVEVVVSAIAEPDLPIEDNSKKYVEGYLSVEEFRL